MNITATTTSMGTTASTRTEATTAPAPDQSTSPLADAQGRRIDYLRLSVTDRCNYRCTYCMPEDGVSHVDKDDILTFEEVCALVRCFAILGVKRVRITGGEPTVRRDLPDLVRMLKAIPGITDLALSTNGHLLANLARPLRDAGVNRLNVSVDTLDPGKFRRITRRGDLDTVLAGLDAARAAGFTSIKMNAVGVKGFNDDEVGAFVTYCWARGMIPRFIEQMPMAGGQLFVPGELLDAAAVRKLVQAAFPGARLVPEGGAVRGAGPARYWRLLGTETTSAFADPVVGIISAMTEHFCDTCNRVRLSAAGHLHTCLGYDDATDLRRALHDGGPDAVTNAIRAAVAHKRDGHSFDLVGLGGPRKAMVQIGG